MKSVRLTKQAEEHLTEIAVWTFETFGPRQADAYEEDLIARCEQIARGSASHQSCAILVDNIEADLRFTRAGQHFVVFLENEDEIIIVDFLHSKSDLPAKIAHLENRSS